MPVVVRSPTKDTRFSRRISGRVIVVMGCFAVVHIGLAVVAALLAWTADVLARRRRAVRSDESITDGLADVIDLFAVTLLSGSTITAATAQVGHWIGGELGEAFRRCTRRVEQGRSTADALEQLADELGAPVRPLVGALVASERYGASIIHNLGQLAADSRADRRRRAETAARRLPVALLFPLVGCVLPAFLLITVVPVVVETLSAFGFVASP